MRIINLLFGPNFKFEIDEMWGKRIFLERFFARMVAKILWFSKGNTYQFGGWTGAKKLSYELVDADKFQLMHWILREAGYLCSVANIMERCNINPEERRDVYKDTGILRLTTRRNNT